MLLALLLFIFIIILIISPFLSIIVVEKFDEQSIEQPKLYSEYPNKCDLLPQKNAANISYLKDQMDKLYGLPEQVASLSSKVTALFAQQQAYADSLASNTPPANSNIENE
jgi:predicted PurR-regulated permease PerM